MPDLEPITRTEKLWSGEDLDPVTRKEMYIKHLYDETQVIPDHPVTREEIFILKAGEELHDVTIEQLTATENGTYSEQGVAYSPVIVEVPEPTLITKSITENGTYDASDDSADGYSSVTVDVQPDLTTKLITANGTYNASADNADGYSSVEVDVPLPENAYLLKSVTTPTPIASFNDGEEMVMPTLKVAIEPIQDLHGYDSPWAGGAGKNKLPMTVSGIKSDNTSGTWNGNVFTHNNGVTFTIETDTDNNVTGIKANGTASGDCNFYCGTYIATGVPISAKGCPSDGSLSTYRMFTTNIGSDVGNGVTSTPASGAECTSRIIVYNGQTVSNLLFKPIIFYASETVTSFEPYSNICPISGWSEANVGVAGKNLFDKSAVVTGKYLSTTTGLEETASGYVISDYIKVESGKPIFIPNSETARRWFYDKFKNPKTYLNNSGNQVFTATEDGFVRISILVSGGSAVDLNTYQVEEGNTATSYEPYNGHTYTIDLDGTRYGGTLDVISGVLTVDRVKMTIDGVNEKITNPWGATDNGYAIYKTMPVGRPINSDTLCDKFSYSDKGYTIMPVNTYPGGSGSNVNWTFILPKTVTSKAEADAWFSNNPTTVTYPLDTPITVQLTPTQVKSLLGSNNVWADTGDITDAEYFSKEV